MANTLVYYDTAKITAVKSLIVQAPGLFKTSTSVSVNNTEKENSKNFATQD